MKSGIWFLLIAIVWWLSFIGGYQVSARTGTEPGYFGAVEAAGYGGGSELTKIEGISDELNKYYQDLQKTGDE